jgi:hypothetical protein
MAGVTGADQTTLGVESNRSTFPSSRTVSLYGPVPLFVVLALQTGVTLYWDEKRPSVPSLSRRTTPLSRGALGDTHSWAGPFVTMICPYL